MSESSFNALAEVLRVLRQLDVPHMLVGAFSSNAYGYPRSTNDADIVVQHADGLLPQIMRNLGEGFSLDPQLTFESMRAKGFGRLCGTCVVGRASISQGQS